MCVWGWVGVCPCDLQGAPFDGWTDHCCASLFHLRHRLLLLACDRRHEELAKLVGARGADKGGVSGVAAHRQLGADMAALGSGRCNESDQLKLTCAGASLRLLCAYSCSSVMIYVGGWALVRFNFSSDCKMLDFLFFIFVLMLFES